MKPLGPQLASALGSVAMVLAANLYMTSAASSVASSLIPRPDAYYVSRGLWLLAGLFLALPAWWSERRFSGYKVKWTSLLVYVIPGLFMASTRPVYAATGTLEMLGPLTVLFGNLMQHGVDSFGYLLIGYGIGASLSKA